MNIWARGWGAVRQAGWAAALAVWLAACLAAMPAAAANKSQLSVYQHGKPVSTLPCDKPLPKQAAVLMGGGRDIDAAYSWMIDAMGQCAGKRGQTAGQPGNFVVLRAGGNPSYDSYIYKLGTVAAVVTLVIPNRGAANDEGIRDYINQAGALFLTGGDQRDYYDFWQGTLLEELVSKHVNTHHVPIGGTSAGMAMLGQFNYVGYADRSLPALTSEQALADPTIVSRDILKNDFWLNSPNLGTPFPPLARTVTDSHFDTRGPTGRMGRLAVFLARVIHFGWASASAARAIGVDQETALAIEYDPANPAASTRRVFANAGAGGAAYFLSASDDSLLSDADTAPLHFTEIDVERLSVDGSRVPYRISVDEKGQLTPADPY